MSITPEQVADLQDGDVVRVSIEGPITRDGDGELRLPTNQTLAFSGGDVAHWIKSHDLTVVSRAPRPLYVNHPRTEPVSGDVVRDAANRGRPDVWMRGTGEDGKGIWLDYLGRVVDRGRLPVQLRLLVDGETGQVAP